MKLIKYDLTVEYIPGKEMHIADTLSRQFIKDPVQDDPALMETVHTLAAVLPLSNNLKQDFVC